MIKRYVAIIVLLIVTAFSLGACFSQPFKEVAVIPNTSNAGLDNSGFKPSATMRTLYVSGAVLNDGFITIPQLCDYKTALEIAGVTDFSVITNNLTAPISVSSDSLIIGFKIDGKEFRSVNVNGGFVTLRQSVEGVEDVVIYKLADYIETNGKITNRNALKLALGDDYGYNYYKFYIDVNDYA